MKTFKLTILSYMQLVIFSWGNRNLMKAERERSDPDNRVLIHLTKEMHRSTKLYVFTVHSYNIFIDYCPPRVIKKHFRKKRSTHNWGNFPLLQDKNINILKCSVIEYTIIAPVCWFYWVNIFQTLFYWRHRCKIRSQLLLPNQNRLPILVRSRFWPHHILTVWR